MAKPELLLLLVPALVLLGYWLYRLINLYAGRGGRSKIGPRGLVWLLVLIGLLLLSIRLMQGTA